MEPKDILSETIKALDPKDPLKCSICGQKMELYSIGKINPSYVAKCNNITIRHPVFICLPVMTLEDTPSDTPDDTSVNSG